MATRWQIFLVGAVCFLLGGLATQKLPLVGAQPAETKGPKWLHGLDFKVRKGGESEWKEARKYGVEVFRDENTGNLVYISETGSIAVISGK
jgi:hypothetical protein